MEAFEKLVSMLDYPMYVVTTAPAMSGRAAWSGSPARSASGRRGSWWACPKSNHTYRVAQDATHLAVHLLPRRHRELARLFGSETGDRTDKFARCAMA